MIESLGAVSPRIAQSAWIHPAATVIGDVDIGADVTIWPGAVIRGDFGPISIGAGCCIQDNAVIHTGTAGTVIGRNCLVGHLAFVEGAIVEDECLIGVGAHVLEGSRIREGGVVAAGAVVLGGTEVPTDHRAQGVPAHIVESAASARAYVLAGLAHYREMALRYRESSAPAKDAQFEER